VDSGNEQVRLTLAIDVHRLRKDIRAATAIGGLSWFSSAVWASTVVIREDACAPIAFLGLVLASRANMTIQSDAVISAEQSIAKVLVVHTKENIMLFR